MNKTVKIVIAVVAVVAVIAVLAVAFATKNTKTNSKLNISSAEDLKTLVNQIYEGVTIQIPMVDTQAVEITDADMVKVVTGLDSAEDIEYLVVSEPMMSSQAYSLVLVKVKKGVNADNVAKTMKENINTRKWICVSAEKVYATTSGDIVCLVMSNADTAKAVYDSFKTIAGSVGQEYERSEEEPELPPEMF